MYERCTLKTYDTTIIENCDPFDCGNNDLNDFFANDALNYTSELLGKSYCFTFDDDERQIVTAFTISNDSIKTYTLPNSRKKKINADIPRQKQMKSYPAVLIGRLGVNKNFRKIEGEEKSIGDQLMDFIKSWFIDKANKTGCHLSLLILTMILYHLSIIKEMASLSFLVLKSKKKNIQIYLKKEG